MNMEKKNAIKREQSQACLSYAEREHFGATLKIYKTPEMQVYDIQMTKILCASGDPTNPYPGPFGYMPGQHEDDKHLMA